MALTDFNFGFNVPDPSTPTYECMGNVVCKACGKHHGYCSELAAIQPGEDNMIPRNGAQSNNRPGAGAPRRKGSGLRYLSAEMLTSTHQLAAIQDTRVQDDNFRPGQQAVVVKLKFKGEFILWTLRAGNPCLDTLAEVMGDDEQTWRGHDIELYIEEDAFDGKKWIRCEVVPTAVPSKKGR